LGLACCALSVGACRVDEGLTPADQVVPAANAVEADDYVLDLAGATQITLSGTSIAIVGEGASVEGTTAVIDRAGTYVIRGNLSDGQIKVAADAADKVKLVLDGVDITTSDDAPIFIKNAAKAVVYLAPESSNTLTDGTASTRDGAIHCKTKLSIFGTGALSVTGHVDDAINAQGGIIIEEGVFDIHSLESGIKSDINVVINGGRYTIDAGNDGVHGEESLAVNGGDITVVRSTEGLEAASVTIAGGTIRVASSDDGISGSSGGGGDMGPGGPPGRGGMEEAGSNTLYVRGGYLYINANGDGLDINGPVEMSDGVIIIDGPTLNNNGALDYGGSFQLTGGYLLAVGSVGMAQMPSASSTQSSVHIRFGSPQEAGTLIHIAGPGGEDILTFEPAKRYQSVVLSSAALQQASGYALYSGGSSTGTKQDGLFSGGTFYGGTLRERFDISGTLTTVSAW